MTTKTVQTAISPKRAEDFPEWYQQVIKAAQMAENSPVRGCMVIRPWGYGLWEQMQATLDQRIKETGHENAYFPLFIPLSFLEKEASHVEGFAKECAVVTHHRLEKQDGRLVPAAPLEEPLIVRPTSETIIGASYAGWIESWRDLPLLINQWANVVRWEMRPRIFLRTTEFLWQEGHTVHATEEEAREETLKMLEVYREFAEEELALPVICGEKSPGERFPGAENTYTIEAMMQDRKALQGGTSHYLGQNFSKAAGIQFTNKEGEQQYGYTTSWGVTTRLIGALIMCHADDDGLRLPPRVAHKQIVILPVIPNEAAEGAVHAFADCLEEQLKQKEFRVVVDRRDKRGGEKKWDWIKKGIPLRVEVGPRELEAGVVMVSRRDLPHKEKEKMSVEAFVERAEGMLDAIQNNLFEEAKAFQQVHLQKNIKTLDEMRAFFTPKNSDKPEIHGGFVLGKWCGDPKTEALLEEMKVTIRCLPLEQSGTEGACLLTGRPAVTDAIFAKSY